MRARHRILSTATTTLLAMGQWVAPAQVALAASFEVTTTDDSGSGSLRAAIEGANGTPAADSITFNIGGPGPHRIVL